MEKLFLKYFKRHHIPLEKDFCFPFSPSIVVVIPAYLELNLLTTLDSLKLANVNGPGVVVLVVVNCKQGACLEDVEQQESLLLEVDLWGQNNNREDFLVKAIKAFDLPKKHFGAGLARKIGMDEACRLFYQCQQWNGVIVSLDADTVVAKNYFYEICRWFGDPKHTACSIYFEHPLAGDEDEALYQGVIQYELHLRYFIEALKYTGFPYAYHSVGSAMAFSVSSYLKAGGMNRRQGGEDFYFLQKLATLGGFGELNTTEVYPATRISNRVPFGTGPALKRWVEGSGADLQTYNLTVFIDLKRLFDRVDSFFRVERAGYEQLINELPGSIRSFLVDCDFFDELQGINSNCAGIATFRKRFFEIFNAFKVVKCINFIHHLFLQKVSVVDAAFDLLELKSLSVDELWEPHELLCFYRDYQKKVM